MKKCVTSPCLSCALLMCQGLTREDIEGKIAVEFGDFRINAPLIHEIFQRYYSPVHCGDYVLLRQLILGMRPEDANSPCPWKQDLDYAYQFGSPYLRDFAGRLLAQQMYREKYDKRRYNRQP